jgi:hypothetical protein
MLRALLLLPVILAAYVVIGLAPLMHGVTVLTNVLP